MSRNLLLTAWPRRALALLALLAGLLALPGAALALETRSGESIAVPAGQTIDDDLVATGRTVTIEGNVTGDVYAFAQTIVVTGRIDGDLIAAGEEVTVDGSVGGDLRAAGAEVTVDGRIGKNVTAAGRRVGVTRNGQVDGSVLAAGQTLTAFGPIGRGLTVAGSDVTLAAPIGGPVQAHVDTLTVAPSARLAEGLTYQASAEAQVPPGTVSGPVTFTQTQREERTEQPKLLNGLFDLGGLIWLVGLAILGILAVKLAPTAAEQVVELGRYRPLQSFGLGLAILILAPFVMLIVGITLVGLPITLGLGLLYGLGLLLAWPALGLLIGTLLATAIRRGEPRPILYLLLGLVVLHLVTHIPYVGGLIVFLGLTFGLGLVAQAAARRWPRPPAERQVVAPQGAPA